MDCGYGVLKCGVFILHLEKYSLVQIISRSKGSDKEFFVSTKMDKKKEEALTVCENGKSRQWSVWTVYMIFKGQSILIWYDIWIGASSFTMLFRIFHGDPVTKKILFASDQCTDISNKRDIRSNTLVCLYFGLDNLIFKSRFSVCPV